jgi:phosphoglycerol transferase MdoB-like AlkP superfamily enzyme
MNEPSWVLPSFVILRGIHIFFGAIGILGFWGALTTRFKLKTHKIFGQIFFLSMIAIALTAFFLYFLTVIHTAIVHPEAQEQEAKIYSLFLTLLGVSSLVSCLNGWAAAELKQDFRNQKIALLNLFLAVVSVGALVTALLDKEISLGVAGLLGLNISLPFLREWKNKTDILPREIHVNYMIGGGIALHTALIAGGGSRIMPLFIQDLGWVAWLIPTVVLQPVLFWLKRGWKN